MDMSIVKEKKGEWLPSGHRVVVSLSDRGQTFVSIQAYGLEKNKEGVVNKVPYFFAETSIFGGVMYSAWLPLLKHFLSYFGEEVEKSGVALVWEILSETPEHVPSLPPDPPAPEGAGGMKN